MNIPHPPSAARYFYLVTFEIDPVDEAQFNAIYDDEHIPNILKVPGVLGVSRFRDLEPNAQGWLVYSAMYFLTDPGIAGSPAWRAESDKGQWGPVIRPKVKSRQSRVGTIRPMAGVYGQ